MREVIAYVALVGALSLPFWVAGPVGDHLGVRLPVELPLSSTMAVCPGLAAVVVVARRRGRVGVRRLVGRVVDHERIRRRTWLVPLLGIWPLTGALSYCVLRLAGRELPDVVLRPSVVLPLAALLLLAAAVEEVGWTAYAVDALRSRWRPLRTGLVVGFCWATWHVVPWAQAGHSAGWIAAQALMTISQRVVMVHLYEVSGRSTLAMVLFHASGNLSVFLFPAMGSHYEPAVAAAVFTAAAAALALEQRRRSVGLRQ